MEYQVVLGDKYKDTLTGFVGFATAECNYMNGTASILLEAAVEEAWKPVSQKWFDAQRLEPVHPGLPQEEIDPEAPEGTGKSPVSHDPSQSAGVM